MIKGQATAAAAGESAMDVVKRGASPHRHCWDDETAPVRNPKYGVGPLVVSDHPEMSVPLDMIRVYARDTPNAPCFATRARVPADVRPYVYRSFRDSHARIVRVAIGMRRALGIGVGDRVGICSPTREDFHTILFTCGILRCVAVPIYESIGKDAVSYIIRHSGVKVVFAAHEKLAVVNEAIARNEAEDGCPHPAIITFDDLAAAGKFANTSLAEVEAAGADAVEPPPAERARPDDVMVIMYTSGTTGNPKGVLISHSAALGSGVAIARKIPDHLRSTDFVILSFMPLAHVFGLAMDYTTLRVGGCVGFYGGDTRKLTDDIAALRPTLLGAVPRVYQRIHDAVLASIEKQNIVKRFAFNAAYFQKYWWLRAGQSTPYSDPIFFGAIREKLGGRLSILVSGGAPLPAHVMEFFRVCVCDNFLEGFGMTETCAIGISTDVDGVAPMAGGFVNAGEYAPYCTSEAKLVSVPSMNYFVSEFPPRGELCIRSTTQFLGYYQDPVRTAEVIDAEGWVHTGDVAVILPNGKIRVIDRVKNMFKLSQGEYVSAEYLEQTITHSSSVQQAFVHGDSQQNYPVAIIVPEAGFFQGWAPQHGLAEIATDMPALCKQKAVYEFIESEVNRLSQEHRLKGYELIKRIHLHPFPFDEARDFLTPSLKLKRHVLRNFFKAEIAEMYSQLPSSE